MYNSIQRSLKSGTVLWAGGRGYEDCVNDSLYSLKPLSQYIEQSYYDLTYSNNLVEQYGCNNSVVFNSSYPSRQRLTS